MNVLASVATHLMTKPSQVVRERQIGQQSQNPLKVRVLSKLAGGEPRLPSETVSVGRRPKRSRNSAPIAGDTASAIPWSPPGDPRVRCMPWTGPPITQRTSGLGHTARDTKNGPLRQEAGMAPPLPNSAHGDQLISAKPRRTARFLSDLHM